MSAIDAYRRMVKTAASGERTHRMLPGRTTKSGRGSTGSIDLNVPEEDPENVTVTVAPPKRKLLGDSPVGVSVTIKVGEQQCNTGAAVDGAFRPDNRVGGGYGTTTLPTERDSMRTPALPGGGNGDSEYVGDIKISEIANRIFQKIAEAQPPLPLPEDPESAMSVAPPAIPEDEEAELQELLKRMKQQNSEFYTKQSADRFFLKRGSAEEMNPYISGGIIAGGMAAPFGGMIGEQKITKDPYYNSDIPRLTREELRQHAQPGDVILTSRRQGSKTFKTPQLWNTGSEFFHTEPVLTRGADGPITMEAGLFNPEINKEYANETPESLIKNKKGTPLDSRLGPAGSGAMYEDAVLMRPTKPMTPAQQEAYLKSMAARAQKPYGSGAAIRNYLRDIFVPKLRDAASKIDPANCGGSEICSTLPAGAFEDATGEAFLPGKKAKKIMPADFLREGSPYKPVGALFHNPEALTSPGVRMARRIAFRGALGTGIAGTGLGAYSLYKHLSPTEEEPEEEQA